MTCRALAVEHEPRPYARRFGCEFFHDDFGTRETAGLPPPLADCPHERSLHRRRLHIDVVAIEAEAGFETQDIASGKTSGRCTAALQQSVRDMPGTGLRK